MSGTHSHPVLSLFHKQWILQMCYIPFNCLYTIMVFTFQLLAQSLELPLDYERYKRGEIKAEPYPSFLYISHNLPN